MTIGEIHNKMLKKLYPFLSNIKFSDNHVCCNIESSIYFYNSSLIFDDCNFIGVFSTSRNT